MLSKRVVFSLPLNMSRLLLFTLPSLVILGLVGATGWRWLRKRSRRSRHPSVVQGHTTIPTTGSRSPASSEDSGVVDSGPSAGGSRKSSHENLTVHHGVSDKTTRQTEKSIPNWKYPSASNDVHSETLSDVDSVSSATGFASKTQRFDLSSFTGGDKSKGMCVSQSASLLGTESFEQSTEHVQKSVSAPLLGANNWRDRKRVMVQLPRDLVGRFIGKQGRNIKSLMAEADGAHVYVNQKNLPKDAIIVPCTVQGTNDQVDLALKVITARYPELDLSSQLDKDWSPQQPFPSPLFGTPRLNGESWDASLSPACVPTSPFTAMVSYIESLSRLWIVPYERSRELDEQHQSMSYTYCYAVATGNDMTHAREGDDSLLKKFCSVRVSDIHWLRGQMAKFSDDGDNYEVLLVDYGSTVIVPHSAIRPLRREHCALPIQAFPCELANVVPNDAMAETGLVSLQTMVEGMILEVHITGNTTNPLIAPTSVGDLTPHSKTTASPKKKLEGLVSPDSTNTDEGESVVQKLFRVPPAPLVELYTQFGSDTPLFINRELVDRGHAIWREGPLANES